MQPVFCPQCAARLISISHEGRSRLACPQAQCDYVFWDNPLPVVAGLVEHQGKVLLIQNKGWPPKWWGLVTGFLERGETAEQGMLREVDEELGLKAQIVSLIGVYTFTQRNQVIMAYHLTAQGQITVGDELNGVKAVDPDKLRPWPQATGLAVADWLAERNRKNS